jgi:hypothetical protein
MDQQTAVFVMSFDGYSDLWRPFFTLFFKYWPDCPFPIYLETNHLSYDDLRVTSLKLGKDAGFSDLLARALTAVPHDEILLFNDDYLLTGPVDTAAVLQMRDLFRQRKAAYFRLYPGPSPDQPLGQVGRWRYGRISPGQRFRTATQVAFFRKAIWQSLIRQTESPRDFEIRTGERSWALPDEFLALMRQPGKTGPVPYFCTGVVRGYWLRGAVELCRRHGIEPDLSKRRIEPLLHRLAHGNRFVGAIRKLLWRFSEWKRGVRLPPSQDEAGAPHSGRIDR